MAIQKRLIHFAKLDTFNDQLSNNNIPNDSIVFIKDARLIWTHGEFYGHGEEISDLYGQLEEINKSFEEFESSYKTFSEGTTTNIENLKSKDTELDSRVESLEKPSKDRNILWIGTSIPAGDIQFDNNGTTQSITNDLGSNNYPKMVANALGFNLYNNSRGASFVCFYPSSEDGTSNWADTDWTEYQNEIHKGYSFSASMAQVEEKFGSSGLNIPEWLLNNFKSYSYESLIIPYIDGTLASCDTVIIDHGYNDRQQILSETSWHIGEGEEMVIGSGRDWLLTLQDPFEKSLTTESYFHFKDTGGRTRMQRIQKNIIGER